jgi:hypothetical protein
MIDARWPKQFRNCVIYPALNHIGLWSRAAERLLLATALVETDLAELKQRNHGPALGVYQIEPDTHDDIMMNFLAYRPRLAALVERIAAKAPRLEQLQWNLAYATAMARLVYYRRPEPLPDVDDIQGMADYWKQHYNTEKGAGTVRHFLTKVEPYWQTQAFVADPWKQ